MDDQLRALERAARAASDDRAAGSSGDVVRRRAAQPGGPRTARVEAIDARSGLNGWTAEVPLVARPEWPLSISLHALDGGALVIERSVGDGDTVLHRLGAP